MLPPEFHRQLLKGDHLELLKKAEQHRLLKEMASTKPSFREKLFLAVGNRFIAMGESLRVLAAPRYNVPQSPRWPSERKHQTACSK